MSSLSPQVFTPETFAIEVERRIAIGEETSYIEATAALVEEMDFDAEEVKHLFSPTLVSKIEAEASRKGLLKEKNRSTDLSGFFDAK